MIVGELFAEIIISKLPLQSSNIVWQVSHRIVKNSLHVTLPTNAWALHKHIKMHDFGIMLPTELTDGSAVNML